MDEPLDRPAGDVGADGPGAPSELGPVQGHLDMFAREGNPLYLWAAWRLCRGTGVPVPDVVLEYLDGVAAALLELAEGPEKASGRGRIGAAIQRALRLHSKGGGPSEFSDYRKLLRDIPIAVDVHIGIRQGASREHAIGGTAIAHGISDSTVRRAYEWLEGAMAGPKAYTRLGGQSKKARAAKPAGATR